MRYPIILTPGERFGRLIVLKEAEPYIDNSGTKRRMYECVCDCGNIKTAHPRKLKRGETVSCGCFKLEQVKKGSPPKHGLTRNPAYKRWIYMKTRCYREDTPYYKNYGGRGIRVCNEWHDPEVFVKWAYENGFDTALELDRIDVNGHYGPDNCRWVTAKENCNNRRKSRKLLTTG